MRENKDRKKKLKKKNLKKKKLLEGFKFLMEVY